MPFDYCVCLYGCGCVSCAFFCTVMATIFYSLDRTLQLITAKMHRAYGMGKAFFQIGHQKQKVRSTSSSSHSGFSIHACIHRYVYIDVVPYFICVQRGVLFSLDVHATIRRYMDSTLTPLYITTSHLSIFNLSMSGRYVCVCVGWQVIDPDLRSWSIRLFDYWENHNEVRKMKGLKPVKTNYKKLQPDEYTIETVFMRDALVRYTNMLKHDPKTADMMNLILHTWVQIRGVRNAAYGFKSSSKKLNERIGESAVGAIFSKLWYERDPTIVSLHQHLKPFGAPLTSMALQIGKVHAYKI